MFHYKFSQPLKYWKKIQSKWLPKLQTSEYMKVKDNIYEQSGSTGNF